MRNSVLGVLKPPQEIGWFGKQPDCLHRRLLRTDLKRYYSFQHHVSVSQSRLTFDNEALDVERSLFIFKEEVCDIIDDIFPTTKGYETPHVLDPGFIEITET